MKISEERKYLIFKISWVLLILGTTCDFMLVQNLRFISFNINITLSTVSAVQYIVVFLALFPLKRTPQLFEENYDKINNLILFLLLILAFASSYFSIMQKNAIVTTISKFTLFFFVFLITVFYCKNYAQFRNFILRTFIYLNFFIILSSIADFYIYDFNRVLVGYFGHMETKHSMLTVDGIQYLRPSGFVTDTNLTAFTIAFSAYLLLLNAGNFNKYFVYAFYILAGFTSGMLASRSALIFIFYLLVIAFILKLIQRKQILIFSLIFFLIQLLTPQTQARYFAIFSKQKKVGYIETGRPLIWKADVLAMKINPVLGLGSGIFFMQSDIFISKVQNKIDDAEYYKQLADPAHIPLEGVNPHNIFFSMLIEYGITGLILFLFLFIYNLVYIFRTGSKSSVIVFIGILFLAFFSNYAPYYKYFLLTCITFYANIKNNLKLGNEKKNQGGFSDVRKILLFRLCCFGDVTMLTPVITNLLRRFPRAEMKIAASRWIEKLLPYLPEIKHAVIYNAPFEKGIYKKIIGTVNFILALRKEKFDMVFTGHRNSFYGLILKLAGIRYRLGFTETKFMTHTADYDYNLHFVDRHINILKSNGINVNGTNLSLIPVSLKSDICKENNIFDDKFVIGIFPFGGSNPGTEMNIKRWDTAKYIELVSRIINIYKDKTIILFEGTLSNEKFNIPDIPDKVLNLTVTPDLISICNIFISGDTGPLYIAEAFSVPTLAIFGPTDAYHVAPKSDNTIHRYIWNKPYCSPCYNAITAYDRKNTKYWDGNTFKCYTGTHDCIKSVSVDDVAKILDEMIKELKANNTY